MQTQIKLFVSGKCFLCTFKHGDSNWQGHTWICIQGESTYWAAAICAEEPLKWKQTNHKSHWWEGCHFWIQPQKWNVTGEKKYWLYCQTQKVNHLQREWHSSPLLHPKPDIRSMEASIQKPSHLLTIQLQKERKAKKKPKQNQNSCICFGDYTYLLNKW